MAVSPQRLACFERREKEQLGRLLARLQAHLSAITASPAPGDAITREED